MDRKAVVLESMTRIDNKLNVASYTMCVELIAAGVPIDDPLLEPQRVMVDLSPEHARELFNWLGVWLHTSKEKRGG